MAYLRNTIINLLNLHYGITALALNSGGVFFGVYLLRAGVSPPLVLASFALIVSARFLIRPFVLFPVRRFGLKPALIFGAVAMSGQYLVIPNVRGVDWALLWLCLVAALGDTFYWTCYHAYFAALGDREHRGHQISAREALASVAGIVAPLLGGWALVTFGARIAFSAVACVQIASALPLLLTPNVTVATRAPGAIKAARTGMLLFLADGWIGGTYIFVWLVLLFLTLGESFTAYGGAMALAALAGAAAGLVLGRQIDLGHGTKAAFVAIGVLAATTLLRAASAGLPGLAVLANALGAFVYCLYTPTMMTAVYNQAKLAPCTFRFHLACEGAWDVGCGLGSLVAALLAFLRVPLPYGVLLALLGAATSFITLRRYYAEHPRNSIAPSGGAKVAAQPD